MHIFHNVFEILLIPYSKSFLKNHKITNLPLGGQIVGTHNNSHYNYTFVFSINAMTTEYVSDII